MASLGVPITIGFKQNVAAAGDYSGINLFDDHFFQYAAVMGTTIATAVSYALTDVYNYEANHNMMGTDSIEYTGGSSYMP